MKKPILLLGFEPFDTHKRNPSAELVEHLAKDPEHEAQVFAAVLPVSARRVPFLLRSLLDQHRPKAVFAFGLYSGSCIGIERIAVNLCDFRIPDADGEIFVDKPVVESAPDAYFSTLPLRKMHEALSKEGIPARLSLSAGSYLCNFLLYQLIHLASSEGRFYQAGFFHLPPLPSMVASSNPEPSMDFSLMIRAAKILLHHAAQ